MSQLVNQLTRDLAVTVDPDQRAELSARIACNLARLGRFDRARQIIEELRREYGDGRNGRVTVWIMLAEGLIHLYGELSPLALDRITRAQVLGTAMRYPTLVALASAWKAHIEFETSKFDAMTSSLRTALSQADESNHDAHARIAIVLSNSFMICGDRAQAQRWFLRGREHALAIGDQASVEALLYNHAIFGFAWLRAASCISQIAPSEFVSLRSEMRSARNLQDLTGIVALKNHIYLWDARLLVVEEKFSEAIDIFQAVRHEEPFAAYNFSQSLVDLELSYCHLRLGNVSEAISLYKGIDQSFVEKLDVDEKLVVSWMLWRMSAIDSTFGAASSRHSQFVELSREYGASRSRLALGLTEFLNR
jgi:tetratricopeptide (TPR) repeat protein